MGADVTHPAFDVLVLRNLHDVPSSSVMYGGTSSSVFSCRFRLSRLEYISDHAGGRLFTASITVFIN
ncbi:1182_t:CDS:2 [Rhizophagus irregularis]|nr:1182_t:CDS:2 [Rhizophagus irregularis]